jgi:hypothetical protein
MTAAHDAMAADPSAAVAVVVAVAHSAAAAVRAVDPVDPAGVRVALAVDPVVLAASVVPAALAPAPRGPWAVEPRVETRAAAPSPGIPRVVPLGPNAGTAGGMVEGMAVADLAVVMSVISARNR